MQQIEMYKCIYYIRFKVYVFLNLTGIKAGYKLLNSACETSFIVHWSVKTGRYRPACKLLVYIH